MSRVRQGILGDDIRVMLDRTPYSSYAVAELTKKLRAAELTTATHTSSLLMLHESRVTQEGALSRMRSETVTLRDRLRVSIELRMITLTLLHPRRLERCSSTGA